MDAGDLDYVGRKLDSNEWRCVSFRWPGDSFRGKSGPPRRERARVAVAPALWQQWTGKEGRGQRKAVSGLPIVVLGLAVLQAPYGVYGSP